MSRNKGIQTVVTTTNDGGYRNGPTQAGIEDQPIPAKQSMVRQSKSTQSILLMRINTGIEQDKVWLNDQSMRGHGLRSR